MKRTLYFAAGLLVGAALFGGGVAYAAGITAERNTQPIYIDGASVQLEAYSIGGNNYVKLRDIGEAVGFNVYWDGAVYIETDAPYTGVGPASQTTPQIPAVTPSTQPTPSEYTINTDHWSREDFSQQANPTVFTSTYDRALYNTFRQTLVDGTSETPAYTMVDDNRYSAVNNLMGRLEGVLRYEHHVPQNFRNYYEYLDYFAVSAAIPENYQAPLEFIQPVVAKAKQLSTDRQRVEYLNDYLCTLLTYKVGETSGVTRTFTQHSEELEAACGSYARAFKFLCAAVDIPCFTISTSNHTWNLVYVDRQWLHVDVALNDLTNSHSMLLRETYPNHPDRAPEQTAFLKELLVPGSTK